MEDIFKGLWVSVERHGAHEQYLAVNCMQGPSSFRLTTFKIESLRSSQWSRRKVTDQDGYIYIKYHKQWDRFAPLIVEYVVNRYKVEHIKLVDVY